MTTVQLLVGLPAAGKTTVAKRLAAEHRAVRLTPDEWMIPLFGESEAGGKRDVLEGRLISLGLQLTRLGTAVVLDFGCWGRDERSALRSLFSAAGGEFEIVYLPIDADEQARRIDQRWTTAPERTFPVNRGELARWRAQFEIPDAAELSEPPVPDPPTGWADWLNWAQHRWPSLSPDP